jgi:PAS domain S-box-containing protein
MSVEQLLAVEYLTQLLDFAPIGVVRVDEQGRIAAWNQKGCTMLGGAEVDEVGGPIFDLLPERDRVRRLIGASLAGAADSPVEIFELHHGGREAYIEMRAAALPSGSTPDTAMLLLQDVTDRVVAENDREHSLKQIHFLAEASAALSSSLDLAIVLERLAEAVVPFLADWCAIDLIDKEGGVRSIVVRHREEALAPYAEKLKTFVPVGDSDAPSAVAIRTVKPQIFRNTDGTVLDLIAQNDEHRNLLSLLGLESGLVVPMVTGGRLLGALTLVAIDEKRRYGASELGLAQDIAQRAALAMENARLFQERTYVARTLQESLLPPHLPTIPGLDVAARYCAAGEGNEVGGDFYDLFATGGGSWGVVIGDVCGKGPDAAALTALARYTTRASAMQVSTPKEILTALNEGILDQTPAERFATVAYARVESPTEGVAEREIVVACAGHPFPIVRRNDGTVEEVGEEGTILGIMADIDLHDSTISLAPGEFMVLYTDGVTEARAPDGNLFGGWKIRNLLESCEDMDADAIAERLAHTVIEYQNGDPRDDIAILVLRVANI